VKVLSFKKRENRQQSLSVLEWIIQG
jgi:hypothetical protein